MIHKISFKGKWFLPNSDNKIGGVLNFEPGSNPKLELFGEIAGGRKIEILLGDTTDGPVTLFGCRYNGSRHRTENRTTVTSYEADFIFKGYHFNCYDQLKFNRVRFAAFNLISWLNIEAINHERDGNNHVIRYDKPNDIPFSFGSNASGGIEFDIDGSFKTIFNLDLKQLCWVGFSYYQEVSFKDMLKDIFKFIGLITFLTHEQSYPLEIVFFKDGVFEELMAQRFGKEIIKPITCIYNNSFYKENYRTRMFGQHLVEYSAIKDGVSEVVRKWFYCFDKIEPVVTLLLSAFVTQYEFDSSKFMDVIRALEVFHRLNYPGGLFEASDFANKINALLDTNRLSKSELLLIRQRLQYANELSLGQRLKFLMKKYSFSYFDEKVKNKKWLCNKAVINRNYYTHFDEKLKGDKLEGKALFALTEKLKLILYSAILQTIDIPPESFERGIGNLLYWDD